MDVAIDKANIDNLTGLWRLMGATVAQQGWWQSNSWPRRCWQDWDNRADIGLQALVELVPEDYLCPVWAVGDGTVELEAGLRSAGFEMGLQQWAMVLPLAGAEPAPSTGRLELSTIDSDADAAQWSRICGQAFGYRIDAAVIDRIRRHPDVEVLWAACKGVRVATAILYRTGSVVGVHQVGVPPEWQGQGIARELMWQLVARTKAMGAEYLCLQASAAGEPLYLSMGFKTQFGMRSYRRG